MEPDSTRLDVRLDAGSETDAEELEQLTIRLRRELLDLDISSVELVHGGDAPPGTRAAGVVLLGNLVVTLAKSSAALKAVVSVIQACVAGHPARSIELTIAGDTLKVSGASSDEQRALINMFVERHSA